MSALFAYGSLMCADILGLVSGQQLQPEPALIEGFVRRKVLGETYPGIIPARGTLSGMLYRGLSQEAWARLDAFEGEHYRRTGVTVQILGGTLPAEVYAIKPEHAHRLSAEEWSFEEFLRSGKEPFLRGYVGFQAINPAGSGGRRSGA